MRGGLLQCRMPEEIVEYSEALSKAISAASPGSTVNLPAGVVPLSRKFSISKQITLQGAGSAQTIVRGRNNGASDAAAQNTNQWFVFNESNLYNVLLDPEYSVEDPSGDGRVIAASVAEGSSQIDIVPRSGDVINAGQNYVLVGAGRLFHATENPKKPEATQVEVVKVSSVTTVGSNLRLTIAAPDVDPNTGADTPYPDGPLWTKIAPGVAGNQFDFEFVVSQFEE